MSDHTEEEEARLEREISERVARLAELRSPPTAEELKAMSVDEVAALDPGLVSAALAKGAENG